MKYPKYLRGILTILLFFCEVCPVQIKHNNKKTSRESRLLPCDENKLMLYLAEIEVVNPENIIRLSTKIEEMNLCKQLAGNLQALRSYLKTCKLPSEKDIYMQLIEGVKTLNQEICVSNYGEKFQRNFETCYHLLSHDYEECAGPPDWTEDQTPERVCIIYNQVVDCYYVKTAKLCGIKNAEVFKELIVTVLNSVIIVKCETPKSPAVCDAMPEPLVASGSNNIVQWFISLHYYLYLYYFIIILRYFLK